MRYTLLLSALLGIATATSAAPRNVVLIVADDLGQDAGCYGNKVLKTPNLDQLAAEGARYPLAFCTTASCSASRSVILSGQHNHANRHYGHEHSYHHFSSQDSVKSLPVMLSAAGYRTARIGKYHVAPEKVYQFDTFLKGNGRNPVEMADNCKAFIADASDKPFFLYFCTADPHRGGGKIEDDPLKPDRFGNKPGDKPYPGITPVKYSPKEVIVPPFLPDTPSCRAELAQYYESVSRLDQGLGRLLQVLKDAKKLDDTLIIFTSDNGIAFPGAKTTLYEPGMRLPCIVRHPAAKKRGVVSNAMVSWVDLVPTILDYAKAPPPKEAKLHGRSFLSTLEETDPKGWDEVYASHTFHEVTMYYPMRVVRERRYKLIWNIASGLPFPFASDLWAASTWQDVYKKGKDALYGKRTVKNYMQRPAFELYDLENDPDEIKNLADDAKLAKRLEDMKAKLKAFQKRTDDPWITKWDYE